MRTSSHGSGTPAGATTGPTKASFAKSGELDACSRLPLCRRYFVVFISSLPVRLRLEDCARTLRVHWGLGLLGDGRIELLGIWSDWASHTELWRGIAEELKLRGVERVQFVVANGLHGDDRGEAIAGVTVLSTLPDLFRSGPNSGHRRDRSAAAHQSRSARTVDDVSVPNEASSLLFGSSGATHSVAGTALRDIGLGGAEQFFELSPRQQRIITWGAILARRLHTKLSRAARRKGCFTSRETVVSFLTRALCRAEQQFDRVDSSSGSDVRGPVHRSA